MAFTKHLLFATVPNKPISLNGPLVSRAVAILLGTGENRWPWICMCVYIWVEIHCGIYSSGDINYICLSSLFWEFILEDFCVVRLFVCFSNSVWKCCWLLCTWESSKFNSLFLSHCSLGIFFSENLNSCNSSSVCNLVCMVTRMPWVFYYLLLLFCLIYFLASSQL